MKKRLDLVLLSSGVSLFLCAVLGTVIAHHNGNGALLWPLVPSFLLIGIGGDRNIWRWMEAKPVHDSVWFAPNS